MRPFLFAISFLTLIPAYGNRLTSDREIAQSQYYFPVVGFIIGSILALLAYFGELLSMGPGGDALLITAWIMITRGFHLDGLMDTADGLFSNQSRERMLEIMKDSRVGAMGAIALAMILLVKFAFLMSLPYDMKIWALLLAPAAGRCTMVYATALFPYARSGQGLGTAFGADSDKIKVIIVTLFTIAVGFLICSWVAVILVITVILLGVMIAKWIALRLGGLTGDTYGAICECTEALFLIIAVVIKPFVGVL